MWVVDRGGYYYGVQRVSDRQYLSADDDGQIFFDDPRVSSCRIHWTSVVENALILEFLEPDVKNPVPAAFGAVLQHMDILPSSDAVTDTSGWKEADAWSISQRILKPGYRLVRLPVIEVSGFESCERRNAWYDDGLGELPEAAGLEFNHFDWSAIRNCVFGEGAAIAAEDEEVPEGAPWSACSDEEFRARIVDEQGYAQEMKSQVPFICEIIAKSYFKAPRPSDDWSDVYNELASYGVSKERIEDLIPRICSEIVAIW